MAAGAFRGVMFERSTVQNKPASKEVLLRQADALRDIARRVRRLSETMELESDRRKLTVQHESFQEHAAKIERQAAEAKV